MPINKIPSDKYSVHKVSETLVSEIVSALKTVQEYGSVEIFVQKGFVTQITVRKIKKTGS